jgi:hypothetical protein
MKTYAKHEKTEVHCVDPWIDYKGYDEYKEKQATNYSICMSNLTKLPPLDLHKVYIHRGFSGQILPTFPNDWFDMIYIDGNHAKQYVFEDAMLAMKKVKSGGWLIFDDVHDKDVQEGLNLFLHLYASNFEANMPCKNQQVFLRRIANA